MRETNSSYLCTLSKLLFSCSFNFSFITFVRIMIIVTIIALLAMDSTNKLEVNVRPKTVDRAFSSYSSIVSQLSSPNNEVNQFLVHQLNFNGSSLHIPSVLDHSAVTASILKRVRVLCFVLTCEKYLETKAATVRTTWAKRCDKTIFISDKTDPNFPTLSFPEIIPGYQYLWSKTHAAFLHAYEQYSQSFDWFLKTDDDTYIIMENMKAFLAGFNSSQPHFFGKRFKTFGGYMSGGAGYVLSKEALVRVGKALKTNGKICAKSTQGGSEDVYMGQCLKKVGVVTESSLDSDESERFHSFKLEGELNKVPPQWYYQYTYHPVKTGFGCCSNYSISFHYVTPEGMQLMEFVLYHLRAFGQRGESVQSYNKEYIHTPKSSNATDAEQAKTNEAKTSDSKVKSLPAV